MLLAMRAMFNETHKGLLLLWNYKFNLLMETAVICFVFVGLNFMIGNGELHEDDLASSLLGYIIWLYTFMAVSNMGWSLREEAQTGTLEQMCMSPVSLQLLMLGRVLATFISTSITVVLISAALVPFFDLSIPFRLEGGLVFAWTLIGLFGLGFIVGGSTLVYKRVESFAYLAQYGLMFLNGSLLPVEKLPDWLVPIAKVLPGTQGIIVLRRVLLDERSVADVWNDGSLRWLMLHSVAFFLVGWAIFKMGERYARWHGTLGHY